MSNDALARRLAERIHREGPIRFDRFMDAALYDADGGFFTGGGGAGRAEGDFVTSPETGSLFGALVARAIDGWWRQMGEPDPFVVVEAGAGRGQLARDVLRASPECALALRYVMVERSPLLRRRQHEHLRLEPADEALGPAVKLGDDDDDPEPVPGTGPIVAQTAELPVVSFTGVVLANELLDNLPFRIVERAARGWSEVRVGVDPDGTFVEVLVPAEDALSADADELLPGAEPGVRIPVQEGVREWFEECGRAVKHGVVAVLDYVAPAAELAARGAGSWLRTYRAHERGTSPYDVPGSQDITADVVLETVHAAASHAGFVVDADLSQEDWLRSLGIEALVEEGRSIWSQRAHLGDLEAMKGRSRISEAEALLHPAGLGAHRVLVCSRRG